MKKVKLGASFYFFQSIYHLFIINNNGYGIIKQFQELYLGGRYEATIPSKGVTNPDFKKISNAYGINYTEIKNNNEIDKVLKKVKLSHIKMKKMYYLHGQN